MNRLLVTGGSGLLGSTVATMWADRYEVATTYLSREVDFPGVDCRQVDLTDDDQVASLRRFDPDAVVHCAALTDVDRCEREPRLAEACNLGMAERVARLANDADARLVHISTDAVFDGTGRNYAIDDAPDPVNVYARTKLRAESAVREACEDSAVVRTSIYGWNVTNGQSLAEWMLSKLRNRETVPAFEDAYFTPMYTRDLATCLFELAENDVTGTLHVAGSERCSKLEFAHAIADIFELDDQYITPSSIEDVDFDARRPKDLSLSVERTRDRLDCPLPTLREGLEHMRHDEYE